LSGVSDVVADLSDFLFRPPDLVFETRGRLGGSIVKKNSFCSLFIKEQKETIRGRWCTIRPIFCTPRRGRGCSFRSTARASSTKGTAFLPLFEEESYDASNVFSFFRENPAKTTSSESPGVQHAGLLLGSLHVSV